MWISETGTDRPMKVRSVPSRNRRDKTCNDLCDLDLWSGSDARHIIPLWAASVMHVDEVTFEMTRVALAFDLSSWNGARHIASSYIACMTHMTWFGQTRRKPWSEHFKSSVWLWHLTFRPGKCARHIVTSWVVCISYELNRWNRDRATERTR